MTARRRNRAIEGVVKDSVGAVIDFDGAAYLDEIADHIRDQLGEEAVNQLLAEADKTTVEEVVLMYLDERTGTEQ